MTKYKREMVVILQDCVPGCKSTSDDEISSQLTIDVETWSSQESFQFPATPCGKKNIT